MTELAIIPEQVVIPLTGELIATDAATDELAAAIDRVKLLESKLQAARRVLGDELLRRMDHEGVWTVHAGGWKVTGPSPGGVEYDGPELARRLRALVKAGTISQAAMTAAVELERVWKPKVRGINALAKLGGEVAEAVEACKSPTSKPRRVSVTPEGA